MDEAIYDFVVRRLSVGNLAEATKAIADMDNMSEIMLVLESYREPKISDLMEVYHITPLDMNPNEWGRFRLETIFLSEGATRDGDIIKKGNGWLALPMIEGDMFPLPEKFLTEGQTIWHESLRALPRMTQTDRVLMSEDYIILQYDIATLLFKRV